MIDVHPKSVFLADYAFLCRSTGCGTQRGEDDLENRRRRGRVERGVRGESVAAAELPCRRWLTLNRTKAAPPPAAARLLCGGPTDLS